MLCVADVGCCHKCGCLAGNIQRFPQTSVKVSSSDTNTSWESKTFEGSSVSTVDWEIFAVKIISRLKPTAKI